MTKFLYAFLSLSFFFTTAHASEQTVKTLVTCEQDDGDLWYSVGLVPSLAPSKYNVVVVLNNEDNGTKKRLDDSAAVIKKQASEITVFNKAGDAKLVISSLKNGAPGQFTILADGPGEIVNTPMICYTDSSITYDTNSSPQPRLTVGN